MSNLPQHYVIENVLQCKMRGKVAYQSYFSASIGINLIYVKPYNLPSGKGYQRPVDSKRCADFAQYLSKGEDALFTPILLNAGANWEFVSYDKQRPSYGRLFCKGKASLMDGQHRVGGIEKYVRETNSDISIPFLAFHSLDEDEEIKLFDTINTKAKGIGPSLSKFLRRDSDDISWIATEMMTRKDSPFYLIGSIIGKRTKGRHVTLQNLYRTLGFLMKNNDVSTFSKEEKLIFAISYYNAIREKFLFEWKDYTGFRITHIVSIDALSIAGGHLLTSLLKEKKQVDPTTITRYVNKLSVDWSVDGPLKYVKGLSGSKKLSEELRDQLLS
ncbi:DNA sulfur modification protein DndB [Paenibacillus endophyticus]|uniref:DNA sulfur modification protein DndB n=1 Tax=Paenibacillus endophyticus TaxID=1294268 RepID=A0A7W5C6Y0_9BACL|nr:DGQHR domain-containing protein [Paenibacillus endophyticus]MBB3152196.1 DNA sulfur modification protein DndB [Paenibacillus endophyticus]